MFANSPYMNPLDQMRNLIRPDSRLYFETEKVKRQFPQFSPYLDSNSQLFFEGYLQTNAKLVYRVRITIPANYPSRPPVTTIVSHSLGAAPHKYGDHTPCLFHPNIWNPGYHTVTFVIARTAKWLNKYEIWRRTGHWPGSSAD